MKLSTTKYNGGLGEREAFLLKALSGEGRLLFTTKDAEHLLGPDARMTLHRLARKKWVLPLRRGLYALVPLAVGVKGADAFVVHNFVIASLLVEPYYIGYWSALNHHGLTEQIPRTTFVATTRARHPVEVLDAEYRFVKLNARKFFGWQEIEIEGSNVLVSTPEKTIVDCLDMPEHCGGVEQVARAIFFSHGEIDMVEVVRCARRAGNRTVLKRLGYILEATGLLERYPKLFVDFRPSAGYPKLDTLSPAKGRHDGRWKLLINYELNPERWQY